MASRSRTQLLHPGYPGKHVLLRLPAHDGPDHDAFPHLALHTAGAIFANNRFDGWLSTSPTGESPISSDQRLLPAGDYYFHVPGYKRPDPPYPLVPNFRTWLFPHGAIPAAWLPASDLDQTRAAGSEACRITGRHIPLETAHILPKSERDWFGANAMDQYAELVTRSGDSVADAPSNQMRLTCDAHNLWDRGFFTLVPRLPAMAAAVALQETSALSTSATIDTTLSGPSTSGPSSGGVAAQDTSDSEGQWQTLGLGEYEDIRKYWHSLPLDLSQNAPQYLFARFAWDIFPRLHGFLHSAPPGPLIIYNPQTGRQDTKTYSRDERRQFTQDQGYGRSASPSKRKRSASAAKSDSVAESRSCTKRKRQRVVSNSPNASRDSAIAWAQDERHVEQTITELKTSSGASVSPPPTRHLRPSRSPDSLQWRSGIFHFEDDEDCRGRRRRRTGSF